MNFYWFIYFYLLFVFACLRSIYSKTLEIYP